MQAVNLSKKEFSAQKALDGAWVDFIASYENGNLSLQDFCATQRLVVDDSEIVVSFDQFRRMRAKLQKYGSAQDRRKFSGRKGTLSTYCKWAIFEDFLNFENLSITGHCRLLRQRLENDRQLDSGMVSSAKAFTYDQVRNFANSIAPVYALFAKEGYSAVRAKYGPVPLPPRYVPGQLWVIDTVTLTQLKFRIKDEHKSPQITFILDAASRCCVYAILHWDNATAQTFISLLQQAMIPERRKLQSDALPISDPPPMLLTDRGPILHNEAVIQVCQSLSIKKLASKPRCPEQNGRAESFAKILGNAFQEELVQYIRELVPEGTEVSDLFVEMENRFYSWLIRYNQTPKTCHAGLTPFEYYHKNRPHVPFNLRSKADIIHATRVTKLVKPCGGIFTYNKEQYRCSAIATLIDVQVMIEADSGFIQPSEVKVYHEGQFVGVASSLPFDASNEDTKPDIQDKETTARFKGQFAVAAKLKQKTPVLSMEVSKSSSAPTQSKPSDKPTSVFSPATLTVNFALPRKVKV
jgi:transposase InsO family protein